MRKTLKYSPTPGLSPSERPTKGRSPRKDSITMKRTLTMTRRATSPHTGPVHTDTLLNALMDARNISVTIPEGATLKEVEHTLEIAIKGSNTLDAIRNRLLPVIGRVLLEVEKRKLWKPEYKNFTEFVERRIVTDMGFGRTNAFNVLKIARTYPSLSEDEYQRIGVAKLVEASKLTDESDPEYREVLDTASKQTVEEFKQTVKTRLLEAHPLNAERPFLIGLRVTADVMTAWQGIRNAEPDRKSDEIFSSMIDLYVVRDQLTTRTPPQHSTARRAS